MADGRKGEELSGRGTFWVYRLEANDDLVVDINGKVVDPKHIQRTAAGKRRGGVPGQRIEIALADCPPFRGDNELGLTLKTRLNGRQSPWMEELEIVVNDATAHKQSSNHRR